MDDELRAACQRAVHVLFPDGKQLRAGRALLYILRTIGVPILPVVAGWIPFVWLVEGLYWLIARYRGKLYKYIFRRFDTKRDMPMKH
ncbi:MAG: hypothetical protein CL920_39600 [Deltaproteobacteria bacterium]|nr:hypothetical protein [Deltaproteobacteria bacterium]MBU54841.1 hypothetical protein [Deltaproteobacteria bacterium]|tara:strand:+ start:2743 stop:3003 length:261 start_codon:yes stop_codon:yes gene_type:complete